MLLAIVSAGLIERDTMPALVQGFVDAVPASVPRLNGLTSVTRDCSGLSWTSPRDVACTGTAGPPREHL